MHWQIIVALVVMVPIVLLPVIAVWMLNLGAFDAIARRFKGRRTESVKS